MFLLLLVSSVVADVCTSFCSGSEGFICNQICGDINQQVTLLSELLDETQDKLKEQERATTFVQGLLEDGESVITRELEILRSQLLECEKVNDTPYECPEEEYIECPSLEKKIGTISAAMFVCLNGGLY